MKALKPLLILIPLTLLFTACGEYQKNPVENLEALREDAKLRTGPVQPRVLPGENIIVEKPVIVRIEESKVDKSFILISPDRNMTFTEGVESSFKITLRSTLPGVRLVLKAQGLPNEARLVTTPQDPMVYTLTWKPSLYSVPQNMAVKTVDLKLIADADIEASEDKENATKLKGLIAENESTLMVFRNQEPPSALTISGLQPEIKEGEITSFSVTVKVPGIDGQSPQKPRLVISYDGVSLTDGNSFLELDGSRYVVADLVKKDPEYLGNSQWKFTLRFDTKNISVQPQLAKNGSVMAQADGTRVRLNFKVYSPYGMSTPEALVQMKILYKPTQPAPVTDANNQGAGQELPL